MTAKQLKSGMAEWASRDAKPWLDRLMGKFVSASFIAWITATHAMYVGVLQDKYWWMVTGIFILNRMVSGQQSMIELVKAMKQNGLTGSFKQEFDVQSGKPDAEHGGD